MRAGAMAIAATPVPLAARNPRRLVWLIQLSFRSGPLHGDVRLSGAAGWDRDEPTSADFAEALETRRQRRTAGASTRCRDGHAAAHAERPAPHKPQRSVQRLGDEEIRRGVPRPGLTRCDAMEPPIG